MTITLDQNAFNAIGLAASALLVTLFVYRGNKRDLTTWLATIVGVALILLTAHYAESLVHLWPHTPEVAAHPLTQAAQHALTATSHQTQATHQAPAARPMLDITDILSVISFGILVAALIVGLIMVRARKQATTDAAMTTNCPSCGKLRKLQEHSYIAGSGTRVTRKLCNTCVNKATATTPASQLFVARASLKR